MSEVSFSIFTSTLEPPRQTDLPPASGLAAQNHSHDKHAPQRRTPELIMASGLRASTEAAPVLNPGELATRARVTISTSSRSTESEEANRGNDV